MSFDIVLPKGNELELARAAKTLGFKELVLAYDKISDIPKGIQKEVSGITIKSAAIIHDVSGIGKAQGKADYIMAPAERPFLESKKIDFVFGAEGSEQKDFFYQKRSGIDDAMCKLARQNGTAIIFCANFADGKNWLGRFRQNARLCRKHKARAAAATFARRPLDMRSSKDLEAFCRAIGLV